MQSASTLTGLILQGCLMSIIQMKYTSKEWLDGAERFNRFHVIYEA